MSNKNHKNPNPPIKLVLEISGNLQEII